MHNLHLEHDLFLLLLNLSQVTGEERIRALFVDSMNSLSEHFQLKFVEKKEEVIGEAIEIATIQNSLGFIDMQSAPDQIDESTKALIRNSVRMLALFLEKQRHDKLLSDEKLLLNDLVTKQTQSLEVSNKEMKQEIGARKEAEEALRDANTRHASMIANIGDVIGIMGTDGIMKYKSPNIEKWFGWKPEDLIGTDGWETVYSEDIERLQKEFYALLEKDNASTTVEYRYKCKDGTYTWIELTATNRINDPSINGVLLNYHDISERKRTEAKLFQAQKMESIGVLAGGVAHDFNNMLSIILGNTEMILEDLDPENHVINNLHEIQNAAERSSRLTRQLLAFARKQTISPKVLDLNEAIEGMLKMIRRLIGENIELTWFPKINLWAIKLDPSQVDQILANLCVNAKDSIGDIGNLTIETDNVSFDDDYCREHDGLMPGDYVMIAVSDNGCGIDKEILDNLFEPFFTTKAVGEGTGLGLATIYGIVKQNKGFINVYSELDKGTTFKIYFPRHADNNLSPKKSDSEEADARGCETILLVEDEKAILRTTTMMLKRLGYTVLAVSNTTKAIKIGKSHPEKINLLMTDVVMPEMNGRDLAKKMIELFPDIKCLYMSGYPSTVIARHGVLDHRMQFIQKPFSKKNLAKKLREVLDKEKGQVCD